MTRWLTAVLLGGLAACAEEGGPAQPQPAAPVTQAAAVDPRDRVIEQTRRLLRATDDDDPQKVVFHLRAAELYRDKWQRPAPGDADPTRWMEQAISSYQAAAAFTAYPHADEVLFRLACLLQDANREDQARASFDRIIKEHPDSPFVAEAWARRR